MSSPDLLPEARPVDSAPALAHVAAELFSRRDALLQAIAAHSTPFYLYDEAGFRTALRAFAQTFSASLPKHRPFYAVKSNHHPAVVAEAVAQGFGLDVSSGEELRLALAGAPCQVLFSGPAKSLQDLTLAVENADRVTVNLDSFGELQRLGVVTAAQGRAIRAGVRVYSEQHGAWSKFGIPLCELPQFFHQAAAQPNRGVALQGIQFHTSWNRSAAPYARVIEEIATVLARDCSAEQRAQLTFIDIGGGYRPHLMEGSYEADDPTSCIGAPAYKVKESVPLSEYASVIGAAVDRHLRPLVDCTYYTEPGRIVSTYAMHIALRVVDKKREDLVIVDGGINMVGWERYLHNYYPLLNLTRASLRELPLRVAGSLCDCEDLFGFHCFATRVEEGDVLLLPNQGAYGFSTAQAFIRPIPPVVRMPDPT